MELFNSNSKKRNQTNNLLGYFQKLKPTAKQPELSESKCQSDCNVESMRNNSDNVESKGYTPSNVEFKGNAPDSVESTSNNPDINPMDIGLLINQGIKINSNKRAELLMVIWKPDGTFKFPQSGNWNLKFQLSWLTTWSWLSYSKMLDGEFCKYCVLFNQNEGSHGKQKLGKLVLEHFSNWKKAIEEFNKHENTNYHKMSVLNADNLLSVFNKNKDSIDVQINNSLKIEIQKICKILVDETIDIAGIEQFSLCARYLDKTKMITREDFFKFILVSDVTGKGLATTLLTTLEEIEIDVKYLRDQGNNGAASMSGQFNGVQAHITKHYPLAHYIHCSSHSLNLTISDTCNIQSVRNCTGTIQKVCVFLKYPQKTNVLFESIARVCPSSTHNRLKLLCPTRWVCRHDSIIIFLGLFDAIIDSLSEVCTWLDKDASSGAY
ncbi:zinc finger MYM-type protein 1-like [Aphis craccivora]|uniref:Zinc finger MYM-type protein 1-like n=1 Tax=Aphis craccivora TaxID=307492 RepID=A0A6G0W9Q4_APHCR|nr:zinc finger MYM-type protein 1-like [Aphis craccivora]